MRVQRIAIAVVMGMVILCACESMNLHAQKTDSSLGAQRFTEYCAGCHGVDGRGGDKVPSLVSANTISLSDPEIFRIVHDGTKAGMPPFAQIGDANIHAVIEYLRKLEVRGLSNSASARSAIPGNADTGRSLYFGTAQCSSCHMMQGQGGFIASDLTSYGRNRTADEILNSITTPDNPPPASARVVTVTMRTGRRLTGVLRNEDNFSLALQTESGRYYLLAKSDVDDVQYTDHSLMPRDYSSRLSRRELDDIVSFLMVAGRNPDPDRGDRR